MNNEIKEIKHRLQLLHAECNPKAREEDINYTLDYITNLQQDLDKANEIIIKDRQFNQNRLLDLAKLKECEKMRDIEFYVIDIIDILNDIRNDENDCNEGSLTDERFIKIISHLIKIYEIKKLYIKK